MSRVRQAADQATQSLAGTRVIGRFAGPWVAAALLQCAGQFLHDRALTTGRAVGMTVLLVLVSALVVVVAGVDARLSRYKSKLAKYVIVVRSMVTATAAAAALLVTLAVGWWGSPDWRLAYYIAAGGICVTWNVRRLAVFTEAFEAEGGVADSMTGALDKLKLKNSAVIDATAERSKLAIRTAPGTKLSDVRGELETIAAASPRRVIAGGAAFIPSSKWGDEGEIHLLHKDVLAADQPWDGPEFPDRNASVAQGVHLARYADLAALRIYPWGDYKAGVAPGNVAQGGAPRSGKGVTHRVHLAELSTRTDVHPALIADTRKSLQFAGAVRGAIGHHAGNIGEVGAMLKGLAAMAENRNATLGRYGFDDGWTPEAARKLGMGAVHAGLEEIGAYADRYWSQLVALAEFCLSSGVVLWLSGQRWSHDRVPTSLRSSVANRLQWGADDAVSAGFLAEAAQAAGVDPGEWKTQFPGRLVAELNGVPRDRYPVMAKGLYAESELLRQVTDEHGPLMLPYWEGDLEVFPALATPPVWADEAAPVPTAPAREVVTVTGKGERPIHSMGELVAAMRTLGVDFGDDEPVIQAAEAAYADELDQWDDEQDDDEEDGMDTTIPAPGDEGDDEGGELARAMASADPHAELAELGEAAAAVDLRTPLPDGESEMTPADKEVAFRWALGEVAAREGDEFKLAALVEKYADRVGPAQAERGRWYLHEMLADADDIEKAEGRRGWYRRTAVGAAASYAL